jgi:Polysaccharide lyase
MHRGTGAIRRCGLVAAVLVLTGVGPGRSVADGPGLTIPIADDFRGGVGPIWRLQRIRADALTVVPDPTGLDRNALAITLRAGDLADSGGISERAELSEADHLHLPTATDVWYSFSLYLPLDFPVVDRRLVLGQWKQGCGDCTADHSPGIANRYRNGVFSITIQDADRRVVLFEEQADIRGRWNHLVYHLSLTPRPDGFLQAWFNGRQVVDYQGPLGYPDDLDRVYFKIGLYRDSLALPMTMLLAQFRRGTSRSEVDPATSP